MKRLPRSTFALAALALFSGCMYSPVNGSTVPSRDSTVPFEGFLFQGSKSVMVEARGSAQANWVPFAYPNSSDTATQNFFSTPLYPWADAKPVPASLWEAGARGYRTQVRARQVEGSRLLTTFDESLIDVAACLGGTSDWYEFRDECGSHASPIVTLETADFVPDVTEGRTDCDYDNDDACSQCVVDYPSAFATPDVNYDSADGQLRLRGLGDFGWGITDHVQGIARLRDIVGPSGRTGRWLQSNNVTSAGLAYYEQPVVDSAVDAIFQGGVADLVDQYGAKVEFTHPSGLQAHGDYVAMALEDRRAADAPLPAGVQPLATDFTLDSATTAAVYFVHFPRQEGAVGEMVNLLELDGSQVPGLGGGDAGVSAVSFVQLADGHFLVAASANNHGHAGIWFYYSDRDELVPETQWRLVDFWEPPCNANAESGIDTCYGGSAGLSLHTDCTGDVYLTAMNGTSRGGTFVTEYQWSQTFRVDQLSSGDVDLALVHWQLDDTGTNQINNKAFRWAGGTYVAEDSTPVIFNTERRTGLNHLDSINGNLFYP